MEIIAMESRAYRELISKIDRITKYINKRESQEQRDEVWLNDADMIKLLGISKRTLQRMRTDNVISYTKTRRVCRYRLCDVERAMRENLIFCDAATLAEFHREYLLRNKR